MQKGEMTRATASTKMNDLSSRSHAVFIIIVEHMNVNEAQGSEEPSKDIKVGKLNLVDLAGSERVRVTGATGKRLEESKKINQSLSALGNVIAALTDTKPRTHIPYRDSKLTRLLEDSLGGNCITTMMAMVSPSNDSFGESLSTVKFANRAKNIRNAPKINEDVDQKTLIRKYEVELARLRHELDAKNRSMFDMQRVMELEDEKKRAEADKEAAIEALEMRSKEYLTEKDEKRKLEERIKMMNSQLLIGGKKLEETPQFIIALEEKQKAIRKEYEGRLQEIEQERQQIEEDKAQIDRYKQLLLRQRDIMIALTARLNERDDTIIQLQEELDAYDKIHRETEENLEYQNARCHQLEDLLTNHGMSVPTAEIPESNHYKEPKRYPPYSTDTVTLDNESFLPLQMLTSEEKIGELSQIIDNQKGEIDRLINSINAYKQPTEPKTKDKDLQNLAQVQAANDRLLAEKQQISTILENDVLKYLEEIYEGIRGNNLQGPQILQELQILFQSASQALSLVKNDKTNTRNVQLRIPNQQTPPAKDNSQPQFVMKDKPANGRRPLTVDEMLMLKRQEQQRKRE